MEDASRRAAAADAFRVTLTDALRPLTDPLEVQAAACRVLGEALAANRVAYFEVTSDHYVIERDYINGVRSIGGRHRIGSFGPETLAPLQAGRTVSVPDVASGRSPVERARAEAALHEADRRKDEFLATLAHELRNPLAPLRTGLELMRLAADDPEVAEESRTMMERQVNQLVHLVDDLLDVSRITLGKIQLRSERVDLAAVVRDAVEMVRSLIEEAGHELTVELPEEPLLLEADSARLAQVLSNLLNNAAKYTQRGGRISLSVERSDPEAIVSVRDNGVGIVNAERPPSAAGVSRSLRDLRPGAVERWSSASPLPAHR